MKRKSLLKRSLAVLLATAMAVMGGGMWKLYFYDVLRACSGKRGFHGRSCFY